MPSPTPQCSSYWKGSLRVTLNYGHQLYFYICNIFLTNDLIIMIDKQRFLFNLLLLDQCKKLTCVIPPHRFYSESTVLWLYFSHCQEARVRHECFCFQMNWDVELLPLRYLSYADITSLNEGHLLVQLFMLQRLLYIYSNCSFLSENGHLFIDHFTLMCKQVTFQPSFGSA